MSRPELEGEYRLRLEGEYRLRDGTRVRIRPLGPGDARTLQDGFRQLSPESRRRRFGGRKARLSESEIRFLTGCDGHRRLALGAVRLDAQGWECEGLGLARYACLPHRPDVAEPSVTVLDSAQGLGLGRLLSEHLVRAAAAQGVKTFRALLADEHGWLRDRILRSYPDAQLTRKGHRLGADFPLPAIAPRADDAPGESPSHGFWSLLRWVSEGSVRPEAPPAARRLGHTVHELLARARHRGTGDVG